MAPRIWQNTGSVIYHVEYPESGMEHIVTLDERGEWICSCGQNEQFPCPEIANVALAVLTDSVELRAPERIRFLFESSRRVD